MNYPKLMNVKACEDFSLILEYENNEKMRYDFSENFTHPNFRALEDYTRFSKVFVKNGNLQWESGEDFCPFTLYEKAKKNT